MTSKQLLGGALNQYTKRQTDWQESVFKAQVLWKIRKPKGSDKKEGDACSTLQLCSVHLAAASRLIESLLLLFPLSELLPFPESLLFCPTWSHGYDFTWKCHTWCHTSNRNNRIYFLTTALNLQTKDGIVKKIGIYQHNSKDQLSWTV